MDKQRYDYMQHCSKRIVSLITQQLSACKLTKKDIVNNNERQLLVKAMIEKYIQRYRIGEEYIAEVELHCFSEITGVPIKFTPLSLV